MIEGNEEARCAQEVKQQSDGEWDRDKRKHQLAVIINRALYFKSKSKFLAQGDKYEYIYAQASSAVVLECFILDDHCYIENRECYIEAHKKMILLLWVVWPDDIDENWSYPWEEV